MEFTIAETWIDEKGDLWLKDIAERKWASSADYSGPDFFELNRISKSGTVWEITARQGAYPTVMWFEGGSYSIRYRE
jgi:hypothetical protein